MERIIPYIMENKTCLKPPTRYMMNPHLNSPSQLPLWISLRILQNLLGTRQGLHDHGHRVGHEGQLDLLVLPRGTTFRGSYGIIPVIWVCLKIVYPYTQWLMIIIPFLNGYFIGNIPNIFRQTHMGLSMLEKYGTNGYGRSMTSP